VPAARPKCVGRKWDALVIEAWCVYEALRRMGFPSDSIYVGERADRTIFVRVTATGQAFVVDVGTAPDTAAFLTEWRVFCRAMIDKSIDEDTALSWWNASKARREAGMILAAIIRKGLRAPGWSTPSEPVN